MSRLSDYSKFDFLASSDEEEEHGPKAPGPAVSNPLTTFPSQHAYPSPATQQQQKQPGELKFVRSTVANSNRFQLLYGERLIYEWEQTLNDVTLYIPTPSFVAQANELVCRIQPQHLQVGNIVQGKPHFFIDEATAGKVQVEASTWTWEKHDPAGGGLLTVELAKANKGVVWEAACFGPPPKNIKLNPMQLEQERQRLLLERWQEENPGMDFRGASFNGQAPDPRTFMGGVSY